MAGLAANIPWERLVEMQLPRLVMMLNAVHPSRDGGSGPGARVHKATQADIDKFLT